MRSQLFFRPAASTMSLWSVSVAGLEIVIPAAHRLPRSIAGLAGTAACAATGTRRRERDRCPQPSSLLSVARHLPSRHLRDATARTSPEGCESLLIHRAFTRDHTHPPLTETLRGHL